MFGFGFDVVIHVKITGYDIFLLINPLIGPRCNNTGIHVCEYLELQGLRQAVIY